MKKILLIALVAAFHVNVSAQKSSAIKTEADSISYDYGVSLAQQGLQQYLVQLGVIADTAEVRNLYEGKIAAENNAAEKKKLEKQLQTKQDSIAKANKISMNLFIDGLATRVNTKEKNTSYFDGIALGSQIVKMADLFSEQLYGKKGEQQINKGLVLLGLTHVLKNEPVLLDAHELIEQKIKAAQEKTSAEKEADLKVQNEDLIRKGENFLNENKNHPEVVTLPSGLQYRILKEGTGAKPTINDKVKVHYTGSLLSGKVFDSSVDRGEPAVFGVGQVIKGWTEALQLMPVGSRWMLYIPHDLAYGSRGAGDLIKPFSTLVFEVELLDIE